jgi:hypothetical protein
MDQKEYKAKLDKLLNSTHLEVSMLVSNVLHLKELLDTGKISEKEYDDLFADMTRIDQIVENMEMYDLLEELNAALTILVNIKSNLPIV